MLSARDGGGEEARRRVTMGVRRVERRRWRRREAIVWRDRAKEGMKGKRNERKK